jgi:hypothetical protein
MHDVIAREVPDILWKFVAEVCHLQADALRQQPGETLPEPAKQLLVHDRDMTSTLARFHGSALRVDVLQRREHEGLYLREVFLRTVAGGRIVEYGVIVIALAQFSAVQQASIRAGETPLGALLHRFEIPFESAPIGFFAVPTSSLAEKHRVALGGVECFGRFNQLARPTGEPLAWIMEILPNAAV